MKEFYTETKKIAPNLHISLDVFADAGLKKRVWDIPALEPYVDHIVIMMYDFYRSSSPQAGPVAPIFGAEQRRWDIDTVSTLKPFLEKIAPEKLLLGIPFYGYEWRTTSDEPNANTYPKSGGIATYKRIQKLLQDEPTIKEQWDRDALSPYIIYKENGKIYEAYYENSRSLSYKLDLVNELGLGGIAIWAVGYEGHAPELWSVIQQKLVNGYYTY
jgi:spore germination protein YaaH